MNRTSVNPHDWSVALGFDQATLVTGHRRDLFINAQDAVDDTGTPQHPGSMPLQLGMSLDNLESVLAAAGMTVANVVRLNFFTTDMNALLQNFPLVSERFADTGARFATSLLGVAALAAPDLVVALEATAVD